MTNRIKIDLMDVSDLVVLLIAGMDTTGHTSEVDVLLYPQIQETLCKELCEAILTTTGPTGDTDSDSDDNTSMKFEYVLLLCIRLELTKDKPNVN